MKTTKKALLLTVCALVLVVATVMGTMAYLTSADKVENTFTVGNLFIQLDEAKTNELGEPVEGAARVKSNDYKLMPGQAYVKDPTVRVMNGSEACYVYVTVDNQLVGLIGDLEDQIVTANEWIKFTDKNDATVYYKAVDAVPAIKKPGDPIALELPVFSGFTVDSEVTGPQISEYEAAQIIVNAYAIQQLNVGNAVDAWNANFADLT